jgi:hypothetical protein
MAPPVEPPPLDVEPPPEVVLPPEEVELPALLPDAVVLPVLPCSPVPPLPEEVFPPVPPPEEASPPVLELPTLPTDVEPAELPADDELPLEDPAVDEPLEVEELAWPEADDVALAPEVDVAAAVPPSADPVVPGRAVVCPLELALPVVIVPETLQAASCIATAQPKATFRRVAFMGHLSFTPAPQQRAEGIRRTSLPSNSGPC